LFVQGFACSFSIPIFWFYPVISREENRKRKGISDGHNGYTGVKQDCAGLVLYHSVTD
jgi:hypothetical protein